MGESWESIKRHAKRCGSNACDCRLYVDQYSAWSARLPADPLGDSGVDTWLWHVLEEGEFHWYCLICERAGRDSTCKISNLLRHQRSRCHLAACRRVFHRGKNDAELQGAPSLNLFKDVYRQFHKGVAPGEHGYSLPSGIVGKEKVQKMCIHML